MSEVQKIETGSDEPVYRFRAEFECFCVFYQSPILQSHVEFKCDAIENPFESPNQFSQLNRRCEVRISQTAVDLMKMVSNGEGSCVHLDVSKKNLKGENMVVKYSRWDAACRNIAKWFDFQRINGPDQ